MEQFVSPPSPGASRHPLPKGEGLSLDQLKILVVLVADVLDQFVIGL
jgi:hypothetical protein